MLRFICSATDHRRHNKVVKHQRFTRLLPREPPFSSYHFLMTSVINYLTRNNMEPLLKRHGCFGGKHSAREIHLKIHCIHLQPK